DGSTASVRAFISRTIYLPGAVRATNRSSILLTGGPFTDLRGADPNGSTFDTFTGNCQAGGANFPSIAQQAGVTPLMGDFDGDGFGDVALVQLTSTST